MKRPWWSRALALFIGLWFVVVTGVPDVTHACPMHGKHAAAAIGSAHADHQASASAAHHSAPNSDSAPQRGTQCTCLGHCCGAAPVAFVSASIALADIVTADVRSARKGELDREIVGRARLWVARFHRFFAPRLVC